VDVFASVVGSTDNSSRKNETNSVCCLMIQNVDLCTNRLIVECSQLQLYIDSLRLYKSAKSEKHKAPVILLQCTLLASSSKQYCEDHFDLILGRIFKKLKKDVFPLRYMRCILALLTRIHVNVRSLFHQLKFYQKSTSHS
jgi:hypothetical protein